jgi:hypothetical protein
MTEVTKFDPNSYVDKIREKIKQSLVDVIPDDQWNTMLRAEIASFFEVKKHGYHDGSPKPSEFQRIVSMAVEEETKKRVLAMLNSSEWTGYWEGNKMRAGEEVARIVRENGAAIMAKWMESAIAQIIDRMRFSQP